MFVFVCRCRWSATNAGVAVDQPLAQSAGQAPQTYEAVDEVKAALGGLLAPEQKENILGLVEIREIYKASKVGNIAGCFVLEGIIRRNSNIRLLRDSEIVFEGELESLKRFKDDVKEVKANIECGLALKKFNDIEVGDRVQVYELVQVPRKL